MSILALLVACSPRPRGVVKAIIFYTPSCNHCSEVVDQTITDLQSKFKENLELTWIDVTGARGREIYKTCIEHYPITSDQIIFPVVLIGDQVLVGQALVDNFQSQIQGALADGLDWPKIGDFECNPET